MFQVDRYIQNFSGLPASKVVPIIDAGHGKYNTTNASPSFEWEPGQQPKELFEWWANYDIKSRLLDYMDSCNSPYIDITPFPEMLHNAVNGRVEVINKITKHLSKMDIRCHVVSIHNNSSASSALGSSWGSAHGTECIYGSDQGAIHAEVLQRHIVNAIGSYRRINKRTPDYGRRINIVLKTLPVTVVTESLFFDHPADAKKLASPEVREQIARAHMAAILEINEMEL